MGTEQNYEKDTKLSVSQTPCPCITRREKAINNQNELRFITRNSKRNPNTADSSLFIYCYWSLDIVKNRYSITVER